MVAVVGHFLKFWLMLKLVNSWAAAGSRSRRECSFLVIPSVLYLIGHTSQKGDTGFTPKILERMGINTCFPPTIVLLGS